MGLQFAIHFRARAPTTPAAVSFESWHRLGALFVAVLVAGLAVWFSRVTKDPQLRPVRWIVLGSLSPLTDILNASNRADQFRFGRLGRHIHFPALEARSHFR